MGVGVLLDVDFVNDVIVLQYQVEIVCWFICEGYCYGCFVGKGEWYVGCGEVVFLCVVQGYVKVGVVDQYDVVIYVGKQ